MNGQKILVVDDSKIEVTLLSQLLTKHGYEVLVAFDGNEAIEHVAKEKIECIIMDIVLSKQYNGFQLCRLFKRSQRTYHIPVILLSSKSTPLDKSWGQKQGADFYMTKPYKSAQLVEIVERFIKATSEVYS